jgi:hypothetical protein
MDGLILSASPDSLRVVLRRQGDTVELRRAFGNWTAEDGSAVELETVVAGDHTDLSCYLYAETQPAAAGAN